jgi:hypothetical protein
MLETLKPHFPVIFGVVLFFTVVGLLVGALAYLKKRRRCVEISVDSHKFALPTPCAESLQSYKIGSVLMSLPDTAEATALENISRAEHYSRIKLTNGTLETLKDCLLKTSFTPLYAQMRRRDVVAPIDSHMAEIKIEEMRPEEYLEIEMWHIDGIHRYNARKNISLYLNRPAAKKYKMFLNTDINAYYTWRMRKIGVGILLFFALIFGVAVVVYWSAWLFA